MKFSWLFVFSCLLVACGGQKPAAVAPPAPPQLTVDGNARLSDTVVPTAYRLDLTIDPAQERFAGQAEIDVELAEATQGIILHAQDLEITAATLEIGETTLPVDLQPGENNGLGLAFAMPVGPGSGRLTFTYSAPLDEVATGLYRVQDGDAWYAFTQFQPLEARQAFPSFDEPKFKTPFTITLRVPSGQLALTNTPETGRTTEGELDVFTFAPSKPLPTYLVAMAVGPLEVLDGGELDGVPFRLVATKGKAALGKFMLENTGVVLRHLTEYFGQPYPYEKLDVVAVPNFAAGAMENVGLVTFRETLLLLDPRGASVDEKRSAMSVMAHELAHMWFGNLVTLDWWTDLWLNEGFATWMAAKVLSDVMAELESDIDRVNSRGWIIGADSRGSAQAMRQTIESGGDVYNAFSAISYGKGAAVLDLFEAWMGEDATREGVRAYLQANAHGTGTMEELLAAFDAASGKPVSEAMATFLVQPGAPLLSVALTCAEGQPPSLTVEQSRYVPAGGEASQTGPWQVPMCVQWPEGRERKTHCALASGASSTIELPAAGCPAWYYPNAGEAGYYRWKTEDANLEKLLDPKVFASLSIAARVEIFSNLSALSQAEVIDAARYFAMVRRVAGEAHRTLARQAIGALYGAEDALTEEQRPAFQKAASALLRPHLKRVGMDPREGEDVELSMLRPTVIEAAAFLAQDPAVTKWARGRADQFVKQMDSVDAATARVALPIAAWNADASLWLSYKLAVDSAPTPAARVAAIRGLGSFRDEKLLKKSLDLFFTPQVRSQDMWALIGPSFDTDATYAVTWAWFQANYDRIVAKLGEQAIPRLTSLGSGFCDAAGRAQVEAFFTDPAHRRPGIERNLASTLEGIDQCVRRRAYLRDGLGTLLR